ncbi:MAG: MauE/DoxX family redox-associated membrane protein [bacterium]
MNSAAGTSRLPVARLRGLFSLGCRLAVAAVFIYAPLDKIAHPDAFAAVVYNYRLLPITLLHPFAMGLPWLELVAGIALLLGIFRRGAAALCLVMTVMFIVAITAALSRGLDISCGCFHTDGGSSVGLSLLFRDVLLLAGCVCILLLRNAADLERGLFSRG